MLTYNVLFDEVMHWTHEIHLLLVHDVVRIVDLERGPDPTMS